MLIIESIKETSYFLLKFPFTIWSGIRFPGQPVTKLIAYSWLCKTVLTPPVPQFT